ncbi:MAG: hypothetical protein ACHQQS_01725 [Thermoanaerobaculales bacterium]
MVAAVVPAFGPAGSALAQTDVTTSRITGTVNDDTGGVLAGVTIAVRSLLNTRGGF